MGILVRRILLWFFASVVGLAALASPPADAETLTWIVRTTRDEPIQIAFYSQKRHQAWPGFSTAYVISNQRFHKGTLACDYMEKICYGAWLKNNPKIYWGVGLGNRQKCSDCCAFCDGSVVERQILQ